MFRIQKIMIIPTKTPLPFTKIISQRRCYLKEYRERLQAWKGRISARGRWERRRGNAVDSILRFCARMALPVFVGCRWDVSSRCSGILIRCRDKVHAIHGYASRSIPTGTYPCRRDRCYTFVKRAVSVSHSSSFWSEGKPSRERRLMLNLPAGSRRQAPIALGLRRLLHYSIMHI